MPKVWRHPAQVWHNTSRVKGVREELESSRGQMRLAATESWYAREKQNDWRVIAFRCAWDIHTKKKGGESQAEDIDVKLRAVLV